MAGSISQLPNGKFYVSYYEKKSRKIWKIYKYKNIPLYNKDIADKLLHAMQNDVENGCFRLEKYTQGETDVIPYLREWLEAITPNVAPATYALRRNCIENHLVPFFRAHPISLHEIQYDNLVMLMNNLKVAGSMKILVVGTLHTCLKFARRSQRIPAMPEFPERRLYQIVERPIRWLSSEDQARVLNAIPLEHQPIFWWLKYHLRRPAEAMALRKEDWDGEVFTVCRGISAKKLTDRIKTGQAVTVPACNAFLPFLEVEDSKRRRQGIVSPFMFVNPSAKVSGKRYTHQALEALWRVACQFCGIEIDLYSGLKHSTASQMVNEDGYSLDEVRMAGQWKSRGAVEHYAKTELVTVKRLLERKVVKIKEDETHGTG